MRTRGFHWFVAMRYLRGAQFTPSTRVAMAPRGADATLGGEVVAEAARNRYRRKFGPFGRPLHWIARRVAIVRLTTLAKAAAITFGDAL